MQAMPSETGYNARLGADPGRASPVRQSFKHSGNSNIGVVPALMQECTSMLREKMWNDNHSRPAPPSIRYRENNGALQPDNALEAMGPVLESVLGNLTQEYERRLLQKDTENKQLKEQLAVVTAEKDKLVSGAAHAAVPQIEYQLSEEEQAEVRRLKQLEVVLTREMNDKSREMELIVSERHHLHTENQRLHISVAQFEEKMLANEAMLANYRAIQDENRRLYNQVQDLQGNIRVFCRTGDTTPTCVDFGNDGELGIYQPVTNRSLHFTFDRVFAPGSTQEQVYVETQPLIRSVLDGYNVCIFAYGQTGSGKTHTMSGTDIAAVAGRGINYRALDDLFDLQHQRRSEVAYEIKVQMLEVYNEKVRDLLSEDRAAQLDIQNTKGSGTNVPEAIQIHVSSSQDVLDVMAQGNANRATADTKMNERSSRSHSVLTVIVKGYNTVTQSASHGCLHLIDLAGSERVGRSEAQGARLEEAKCINKSLSAIGDVMSALASKSKHIPFRNSKLTQLLADSLSGQAKVMMFVHVSPEASSFQESTSSLKFGSRVSDITLGQAKKNVEAPGALEVKEANREMKAQMVHLNDALSRSQAAERTEREATARMRAELAAERAARAAAEQRAESSRDRSGVARLPNGGPDSGQRRALYSTQSSDSASSSTAALAPQGSGVRVNGRASGVRASAGAAATPEGGPRASARSTAGVDGGGGSASRLTPEEKHIRRMRQVMIKREQASGLPNRPRTALGATTTPASAGSRKSSTSNLNGRQSVTSRQR